MPSSPNSILKAIRQLMANNTPENARALAEAAGLRIKPVITNGFVKKGASRYEYIIWGVPKDGSLEELLFTQNQQGEVIATIEKAKDIKALLEDKYGVTKARIQEVDLGSGFDFSKEIAVKTTDKLATTVKPIQNYQVKDIEKTIKKWQELKTVGRSIIIQRLDAGWYVEKKKTGVASKYEFTNGEQYLVNSKKNGTNNVYDFIYFAMNTFGDLKTALDVSGVLNRLPQEEAANLTAKLKELRKQGKISESDYSWSTLVINDAAACDGDPYTVKTVETIKKQFISPLSAPVAPVITQSTDETSETFGEQENKNIAQVQTNSNSDLKYSLGQFVESTGGNKTQFFIFAKRSSQKTESSFQNNDYLVLDKNFLTISPIPYSEEMLKPSMVSEFYLPPYTELQNENILNARYDYLVLEVEKYVKQQKSSNHKLILDFEVISRSDFLSILKNIMLNGFESRFDAVGDLKAERQKADLIIQSIPKALEKLKLLDENSQVLATIKLYEKNLNDLQNADTLDAYEAAFKDRVIASEAGNKLIGGKPQSYFNDLKALKEANKTKLSVTDGQVKNDHNKNLLILSAIKSALAQPTFENLQELANRANLGLITKPKKVATQEQFDKYNQIAFTEGSDNAEKALREDMRLLGYDATERQKAIEKLHLQFLETKKQAEAAAKKAERDARSKIKPIVTALLAKTQLLRGKEFQFLEDIKTKRVLSIKQRDWLEAIAKRLGVAIDGDIGIKASQRDSKPKMSFEDWAEDFLDVHVALMGEKEREEAYKSYSTRFDDASDDYSVNDPQAILSAMRQALDTPSDENIQALAREAGLEIAQPQNSASDLNAQEQAVMDVMLKSGVYNFATMRDNEDFSKLAALSENEFEIVKLILEDTEKELTKKVVKHILENSTDYPNAIGKNMVANSDLDGMDIAPLAKLAKIKKTAKTPDDLFKLMASSTANQDVRYYLTGVKVEDNGDLISTDGHSMTIIRDSGINREAGIYTTTQRLEGLKRALLKQGKSQEEIDKDIKAQEDSFKEHKFPEYQRVYPKKNRFVAENILKIDVAKLKGIVDSIVKAFKRVISNKFLGVSLEFNQNEIVFNVQYLQNGLDLMASMGYKQVNLYLQEDARSPILIEPEDEKVSFVVMPMVDNRNHKAIKTINLNNLDDWNWSKSNFDDIDTEDDEDFEDEDINQLSFF